MAGFEVVVRPVILPNIRPARAQTLPPIDDPAKGICEIRGTSPHIISLSYSMSVSGSETRPKETERRVDTARVYQIDDSGVINRDNFVDIEVANRITMDEGPTDAAGGTLVGIGGGNKKPYYYEPVAEGPNIEITKRNKIDKAGMLNPDLASQ